MISESKDRIGRLNEFVLSCKSKDSPYYSSVPNGEGNLYATCYAVSIFHYIGEELDDIEEISENILNCQESKTGNFIGPELENFIPKENSVHSLSHIQDHLNCTVLGVLGILGKKPRFPLYTAHSYCNQQFLKQQLDKIDWKLAWLEGNNLLFIGQYLIFLRDVEELPEANNCLKLLFDWLDSQLDPNTGCWGTNGYCDSYNAIYGGYHQLLLYYYENRTILFTDKLLDTTLGLQYFDGGFARHKGGGACEDVDAVDILVNLTKITEYKRAIVYESLVQCKKHLLNLQNSDGGFPYSNHRSVSQMGLPKTFAEANESNLFSTWFRCHTLSLISEILIDHPDLDAWRLNYNPTLSMGWHRHGLPSNYKKPGLYERIFAKGFLKLRFFVLVLRGIKNNIRRKLTSIWRRLKSKDV